MLKQTLLTGLLVLSIPAARTAASVVISGWDFQNAPAATNLTPASDLGSVAGSASILGMTNAYPTPGPSVDISDITSSPGSSDPAGANNNGWRVRGGQSATATVAANGWSSLAPIGTQGAQFLVNTTGFTGIKLRFDLNTTAQAEANLEVLYTLDGATWTNIPVTYSGTGGAIKTNSTSSSTVSGTYIQFTGAAWFNGIAADFSGIAGANNNPKFGVRLVNASTGADNINAGGTALNNSSGNWRFDEVQVTGTPTLAWAAGNLMVSRSVYVLNGAVASLAAGQPLPDSASGTTPYTAAAGGQYPNVFNNAGVDASYGVTSPMFLDEVTPSGTLVGTLGVPADLAVTSFPSKSEIALNLTADGTAVTFMGYAAPVGAMDVSNSNTPGVIEPGNFVTAPPTYREIVQVDYNNNFQATTSNAYSGNNGRAAILAGGFYYMTGNAGNGNGPPLVTAATGVQLAVPGLNATASSPGTQQIGTFNITQAGYSADKTAKDNNFRGALIYANTLYVTKGSGSNGINTVYQVGAAGTLPTPATAAAAPITILPGFSTTLASAASGVRHPFGIWFANASTLYVADEGDGILADLSNGTDPTSGLQKWILVGGSWQLAYTLQSGLNLGVNYTVSDGQGNNYFATATDGLRNLTGKVNGDGTVTLYAVTSTVSGAGDQGADPNRLVAITDTIANTTKAQAANETFTVLRSAGYGEVLRGVCFAPGPGTPTAPAVTLQPSSSTVTVTGSVTLSVAVTGTPAPTFQWMKNGTAISGATGSSFTIGSAQTSDAGSYTVVVTNASGTVTSGAATLTVTPPTLPVISTQPTALSVALGASATFNVAATGAPAPTYQWYKNGVAIAASTGTSLTIGSAQLTDTGIYTVVATNQAGPVTSNTAGLAVKAPAGGVPVVISGWDFQNLPMATNLNPAPDLGTVAGAASTVGMNNNYPSPGPSVDISDVTGSTGSSDSAGANNNAWRVRGGQSATATVAANGWSSLAPIGTQGAQFLVNTTGFTGIHITFDLETTAQAEANLELLYTLDGSTWINLPVSYSGPGATVKTNSTSPLTVNGSYIQFTGGAWFNQITADLSAIPGAANNPNFGIRMVNASTGADDVNGAGTPYNNNSGNWRFDEVQVLGTAGTAPAVSRLVNTSSLGLGLSGGNALMLGFTVGGVGPKPVLVRAIGPGLKGFGLSGTVAGPSLQLLKGTSVVASNSGWTNSAAILAATSQAGAFPLAAGSADSVILSSLTPGAYTALVSLQSGDSGTGLLEIYDAAASPVPASERITNTSTLGAIGPGSAAIVEGFVIGGPAQKKLLIRGLGPALASFNVSGAISAPMLQLYQGGTMIAVNAGWGGDATLTAAMASTGAFALPAAGKDSVLIVGLQPGAYTARLTGVGGATGAALIEVYELP